MMPSAIARGRIGRSRRPRTGGPKCSRTRAPAYRRRRASDLAAKQTFYRLGDERRDTILVACSKCDWEAAFRRDELLASHGPTICRTCWSASPLRTVLGSAQVGSLRGALAEPIEDD
jgi:hypothetical protein